MIRTRNLMHLTDPSSNVFASVSSFNLPFFDSPIVATTKKINSVTSLSWNTKILNVVFIARIFYFSAGNFSLFLPQMSTFHPYYRPEKTAGSAAQSFLPGQKKNRERKSQFPLGKHPPGHTCITQKRFFTTIHLSIPLSEKNIMTWICPWEQDGGEGKYSTAEKQRDDLQHEEIMYKSRCVYWKWCLPCPGHTHRYVAVLEAKQLFLRQAFEGHSTIRLLLEQSFLWAWSPRNSSFIQKAPSN